MGCDYCGCPCKHSFSSLHEPDHVYECTLLSRRHIMSECQIILSQLQRLQVNRRIRTVSRGQRDHMTLPRYVRTTFVVQLKYLRVDRLAIMIVYRCRACQLPRKHLVNFSTPFTEQLETVNTQSAHTLRNFHR